MSGRVVLLLLLVGLLLVGCARGPCARLMGDVWCQKPGAGRLWDGLDPAQHPPPVRWL